MNHEPRRTSKFSMKRLVLAFGLVSVFTVASVAAALSSGQRAPEIGLRSLDGNQVTLSSLRGKVVLVDFWATWCSPCRDELPHLQRLSRELANDGLVVVGVSVDRESDNVRSFVRRLGLTFPIVHDEQHVVADRYRPTTMPTSYIIDRDGVVRFVHQGFQSSDVATIERELRSLLADQDED